MGKFVEPSTYLIGYPQICVAGLAEYLSETKQEEFLRLVGEARSQGLSDGEILCSFYAKLCYKSLVVGKNQNIDRIRDIHDNLESIFDSAHGAVLEHANINFVATNVSRVFTHELVRHRVGFAYSQTSGRYVRGDTLDFVLDPILQPAQDRLASMIQYLEVNYMLLCDRMGLNGATKLYSAMCADAGTEVPTKNFEEEARRLGVDLVTGTMKFDQKKKVTSALRRILPNGQSNEIGFSVNIRSLRHFVMVRSSRHAEWEIRKVAEQVFKLVNVRWPMIFHGAKVEDVNGAYEITGMTMQPYDVKVS